MGPEAILLSVKQNGREGSYRFTCPTCTDPEVCGDPAPTGSCALADGGRVCSADCWCWEYPLPHGYTLKGAHFRAPNDGWAVGELGHVQHWDGTRWTRVPGGTAADLRDIHRFIRYLGPAGSPAPEFVGPIKLIATGGPKAIQQDPEVIRAYLGSGLQHAQA